MREAVIVDTLRTPIGRRKGKLSGWHPADLLGLVLSELVERTGVDPGAVDDVVGGCVTQVGEQSTNIIRNSWVGAGLPAVGRRNHGRPPVRQLTAGHPLRGPGRHRRRLRRRHRLRRRVHEPGSDGVERLRRASARSARQYLDVIDGQLMTQFEISQILAGKWGITRDEMDAFAVESHRRAQASHRAGAFEREIVPVAVRDDDGNETGEIMTADEGIRPGTTLECWPPWDRRPSGIRRSLPTSRPATRRRPPTAPPPC